MSDRWIRAEPLLAELERQLDRIDARLLAADPGALQNICSELRQAALALARALEAPAPAAAADSALRRRIEGIAQRLAAQRTQLARRSAVLARSLDSLMSAPQEPVYSVPGSRMAFGAAGLQ